MAGNIAHISKPLTPGMRRSATLPLRSSNSTTAGRSSEASSTDQQVETLFMHPSVRIVFFETRSSWTPKIISKIDPKDEEAGNLPWTSPIERLIAFGPLHIYRARGSVAFLSCGKVVHPILLKSQCWCVDDASSKYVLQIRRPQYWRIEVPVGDEDEIRKSEDLKDVFSKVLLFEKTMCPFQRSFTVELPEAPLTPLKKRPWRPVERPKRQPDVTKTGPPETVPSVESGEDYYTAVSDGNSVHEVADIDSDATDDTNATPRNPFHRSMMPPLADEDLSNDTTELRAGRSVTAPPQLTIITSSISEVSRGSSSPDRSTSIDSISSDYSSSVESFHTVQSWHSPITPLPLSPPDSNPVSPTTYPYPHDNISLPKRPIHEREMSELTVTPGTPRVWDLTRNPSTDTVWQDSEGRPSAPKTPTLVIDLEDNLDEEHFEIATPPTHQNQIKHRPTTGSNSRRRALSPLPAAANLFSPPRRRPRHLQTARHLPTAIIQKTCEILLSPPSHLLHLMLDIAAKIAAGEWRGMVFGFGEGGEKIVGQWDYEDGEMVEEEWEEDDYGISLTGKQDQKSNSSRERIGRSWEID